MALQIIFLISQNSGGSGQISFLDHHRQWRFELNSIAIGRRISRSSKDYSSHTVDDIVSNVSMDTLAGRSYPSFPQG